LIIVKEYIFVFMIDLDEYKNKKKLKDIVKDLEDCKIKLTGSLNLLEVHKKYIPIMESISVLHNSRTLIEIHLNKYKNLLEKELE